MKTIFKNQFTYTKDYYNEYYKYICFKSPVIFIIEIIYGISFIISILSIILPQLGIMDIGTAVVNIDTLLIILCLQIYVFFRSKDVEYKRELEKNNGNPTEVELSITEENINILLNHEKNINIKFDNIAKVIRTKSYYILVSKAKLNIAFKKDSFTQGTEKEFEQFLKQKNL